MAQKPSEVPVKVTPTSREVSRPARSLREQMDRWFEEFGDRLPWRPWDHSLLRRTASGGFGFAAPAVDVSERDDGFELTAELPGVEQKDVEVVVDDDVLIVRGEKKEEREEKHKDYHLSERSYGSFQRAFTLPANVQADQVSASFKNGVLKVTLPKNAAARARQRRVEIKG